jgi:hypothetical protein
MIQWVISHLTDTDVVEFLVRYALNKYTKLLLAMGPSDRELVLAHVLLSHADARSPSLRTVIFVSRKTHLERDFTWIAKTSR